MEKVKSRWAYHTTKLNKVRRKTRYYPRRGEPEDPTKAWNAWTSSKAKRKTSSKAKRKTRYTLDGDQSAACWVFKTAAIGINIYRRIIILKYIWWCIYNLSYAENISNNVHTTCRSLKDSRAGCIFIAYPRRGNLKIQPKRGMPEPAVARPGWRKKQNKAGIRKQSTTKPGVCTRIRKRNQRMTSTAEVTGHEGPRHAGKEKVLTVLTIFRTNFSRSSYQKGMLKRCSQFLSDLGQFCPEKRDCINILILVGN
jgi:hypothetical protein